MTTKSVELVLHEVLSSKTAQTPMIFFQQSICFPLRAKYSKSCPIKIRGLCKMARSYKGSC